MTKKKQDSKEKITEIKPDLKKVNYQFLHINKTYNKIPEFVEVKEKDYIKYGDDNLFDRYLLDLLNHSSKHSALINRKTSMMAGAGFKLTDDIKLQEFISNKFGNETLTNIALKNSYDLNIFGSFGLITTWSKDRNSVSRIKHISPTKFRIVKDFDKEEIVGNKERQQIYELQQQGVNFFYISSDWSNIHKKENKPKLIQGFSTVFKDEPTQILYVKIFHPSLDYYTYPDYYSALQWIKLDTEVSNFHLNSIQNGFTPSMIISFKNGIPSDEEMRTVKKKLNEQYAGSSNGSEVFITYTEQDGQPPEFIPIQSNTSDEKFLGLEQEIMSNIIVAHNANPHVMGVQVAGKLSTSKEIFEAETVFNQNVIKPKQKLLTDTYNSLARINNISTDLKLETLLSFDNEFIEQWIKPQALNKNIVNNEKEITDEIIHQNKRILLNGNDGKQITQEIVNQNKKILSNGKDILNKLNKTSKVN